MPKQFTGFNRNEKLLVLENRLIEFESRFRDWNRRGFAVPEHIYRDYRYNKQEYVELAEDILGQAKFWAESIGLFTIGGSSDAAQPGRNGDNGSGSKEGIK